MNPDKKIKNLRGEEVPMSLPTQTEIDKLPKDKDNKPDFSKLERETVGNIILNCLTHYIVRDRKEGSYINSIAQSILAKDKKAELKDKLKKFLIEVLDEMTHRREIEKNEKGEKKEIEKGLYAAWSISQVKQELGIKEE